MPTMRDTTTTEARHAVALPPASDAPPAWVHLMPVGTFSGRDGRGPWRLDADAVLAAFAANQADLPVDFDHQSLSAAQKAGPVPAAGWIKELDARDDGLWGRVEWTPRAAELLANKEYRYLSPVFRYETRTGAILSLTGAGLTNSPNLLLRAAAAQEGAAMYEELMQRLIGMLNLPMTTTPDEMVTHLQKVIEKLSTAERTAQAAQAQLAAGPDPTQWVPKTMYDEAAQRLSTLATERTETAVQQAVTAAMSARKVTPAMQEWALAYARRDLPGFQSYVATAPEFVSGETRPPTAAHAALTGASAGEQLTALALQIQHADKLPFADALRAAQARQPALAQQHLADMRGAN